MSTHAAPDANLLKEAAKWLSEAKRPFLIAGSGVFYANAGEPLAEFARATDIPILSHLWDRGCVQEALPQYVGVTNPDLTGAFALLSEADLVLTLGARWDYRLGMNSDSVVPAGARIIRVDVDPAELARGRAADLAILADARSTLEELLGSVEAGGCASAYRVGCSGSARRARRCWRSGSRGAGGMITR